MDSLTNPTRLLAAERSYPAQLAGLFELPGGKVEIGENPEVALAREIAEELGTALTLGVPVPGPAREGERTTSPGFDPWPILQGRVMWVWLAQVAVGAPRPRAGDSHTSLKWVDLDAALSLPWIPTNRPIIVDTLTRIAISGAAPFT